MNAFIEKENIKLGPQGDDSLCDRGETCLETGATENLWESIGSGLSNLPLWRQKYTTSEWYPRFTKCMCMNRSQRNRFPLLTTTSGVPVATAEGAELLGITADKLVMACRRGTL